MADATLILLRHGESDWNEKNLFTGWVDVDLTEKGRAEAVRAGELIKALDRQPDVLYTSLLRRAINTANLALDAADRHWIPVHRDWRLNERHYGAVHGLAAQLRHPAATDRAGQRVQPRQRSSLRRHPWRAAAHQMSQGRRRAIRAVLHRGHRAGSAS